MGLKFDAEVGLIAMTVDRLINERIVPLIKELAAVRQELVEANKDRDRLVTENRALREKRYGDGLPADDH